MAFCTNCGSKISENDKFCSSCGSKIQPRKKKSDHAESKPAKNVVTEEKIVEKAKKVESSISKAAIMFEKRVMASKKPGEVVASGWKMKDSAQDIVETVASTQTNNSFRNLLGRGSMILGIIMMLISGVTFMKRDKGNQPKAPVATQGVVPFSNSGNSASSLQQGEGTDPLVLSEAEREDEAESVENVTDPLAGDTLISENEAETQQNESINTADMTVDRPIITDFEWYRTDVLFHGCPDGAFFLTDSHSIEGDWKAYIIYDRQKNNDFFADELMNITLKMEGDELEMKVDPYYLRYYNDPENTVNESEDPDYYLYGKYDGIGVKINEGGEWNITPFYTLGDKEYAYGTIVLEDGMKAEIALVRP